MEGIIPTPSFLSPLARRRISSGENGVGIVLLVCEDLIRGGFYTVSKGLALVISIGLTYCP